jgi:hypothetical protein
MKNPLEIKNPEFKYYETHVAALDSEVAISHPDSGYKDTRFSTLTFRVDNRGGYPMRIAIRLEGQEKWHQQPSVGEISIGFVGDFEANDLVCFLQKAGLMSIVTLGKHYETEES